MGLWGRQDNTQHSSPLVNVSCVDDKDDNVAIEGGSQLMQGQNLPLSLLQSWGKERGALCESSVALLEGFVWPRVWQGQS